jgi:protein OS-9
LNNDCFLRHEGWWSYEFFYQAKVRQFHQEEKKIIQEFVLGVYDKDATAALHRNSPDVSLQKDPRSKTAAQRYHAHGGRMSAAGGNLF